MTGSAGLIYALANALQARREWPDRASIAAQVGAHRAALHPWLNHLAHHRAIREADTVRVDPARLLAVLAAHRTCHQRPETPMQSSLDLETMHARLSDADITHAFGLFTAANQWAFFEPRAAHQLYLAQRDVPRARQLLQTTKGETLQLFVDAVDRLPRVTRGGLPVTEILFTCADLRAHPEGGAHAAFLEANVLRGPA